jgi:hypothetical protein
MARRLAELERRHREEMEEAERQVNELASKLTDPAPPSPEQRVIGAALVVGVGSRLRINEIIAHVEDELLGVATTHSATLYKRVMMSRWKSKQVEGAALLKLKRRAAASFMHRAQHAGYNSWLDMVVQQKHKLLQLRAGTTAFRSQGLRKGLNTLITKRLERREMLDRLAGAGRALVNRHILKAWNQLRPLARMFRIAKRAAANLLRRGMRKGLNGWLTMLHERAALKMQLRAGTTAFRSQGLRKGLNTLIYNWEQRREMLDRLAGAGRALVNRHILKAWNQLRSLARMFRIAKRAAANLLRRGMRKGLNGWLAIVHERAAALLQLRAAAAAFRQRGERAVLNTLLEQCQMRQAVLKKLRPAVIALMRREHVKAWKQLAAAGRLRGPAKRAARGLLFRDLRKGLKGWGTMLHERALALAQMRAAAAAFRQRGVRAGLSTLIEHRLTRQLVCERLGHAAVLWKRFAYDDAVRIWRDLAARTRSLNPVVLYPVLNPVRISQRKAEYPMLNPVLRARMHRYLRIWIYECPMRRCIPQEQAAVAGRAVALLRFRRAFNSWMGFNSEQARLWESMHSAIGALKNLKARRGLNCWLDTHESTASEHSRRRKALSALLNRNLRLGMNSWQSEHAFCMAVRRRQRSALMAIFNLKVRRGLNKWLSVYAFGIASRRRFLQAMAGWQRLAERRALNSWIGRDTAHIVFGSRALLFWQQLCADRKASTLALWVERAALVREAKRTAHRDKTIRWANTRSPMPRALTCKVAADDVHQVQKAFMVPHSALAVRVADGALLRVVGVQRPTNGRVCEVELTRGHDELMLMEQPLPSAGEAGARVRAARPAARTRVSATALSAPAYVMVPNFFGGVLPLSSGLEVRILDAEFDPIPPGMQNADELYEGGAGGGSYYAGGGFHYADDGSLPLRNESHHDGFHYADDGSLPPGSGGGFGGDGGYGYSGGSYSGILATPVARRPVAQGGDGGGARENLARVRVTLVDGKRARVGEACWCNVHELLCQIQPSACVAADLSTESELRDRTRLDLHAAEQRRLALAFLTSKPQGAFREAGKDDRCVVGLPGLLRQLDAAAPSVLLEAGKRRTPMSGAADRNSAEKRTADPQWRQKRDEMRLRAARSASSLSVRPRDPDALYDAQ